MQLFVRLFVCDEYKKNRKTQIMLSYNNKYIDLMQQYKWYIIRGYCKLTLFLISSNPNIEIVDEDDLFGGLIG